MLNVRKLTSLYGGIQLPKTIHSELKRGKKLSEVIVENEDQKVRLTRNRTLHPPEMSPGSIFLPMTVNPSIQLKTDQIRQTYAFAESSGNKDADIGVNFNYGSLKAFVESVVSQAIDLKAVRSDEKLSLQSINQPHFTLVVGKKGVGKTHLQNYVLSEFSEYFDQKKTLWVRINLIRDFGDGTNDNISDWIKAQIAKIVIRYYDSNSEYHTISRPELEADYQALLYNFVENGRMSRKDRYFEQCDVLIDRLQRLDDDEQIDPQWMPRLLINEVYRKAKSIFNIVVVIDGLDLLTETQTAREKYEHRRKAITKYLTDDSPSDCFNLLFVRPKTLEQLSELQEHIQSNTQFNSSLWSREYRVTSCSARSIFYKRIEYLSKADCPYNISTSALRKFEDFVNSEQSDVRNREGEFLTWFQLIGELAKDNARSAVQALSAVSNVIDEYANSHSSKSQPKKYHFIEHAMLGASFFPPISYSYSAGAKHDDSEKDPELVRSINQDAGRYDTVFVPSIFNFPYPQGVSTADFFGDSTLKNYLLPLRILQFISHAEQLPNNRMRLDYLIDILETVYGFNNSSIIAVLEELSETEVIDIEPITDNFSHWYIPFYSACLTVKGHRILNQFLLDLSYLTLSFITTPLPHSVCRNFELGSPKLQPAHDWIKIKVVNGLAMLSIIEQANLDTLAYVERNYSKIWEKLGKSNRYSRWHKIILNATEADGEFYDFIEPMKESVLKAAEKSIYGYEKSRARSEMIEEIEGSLSKI